MNVNIHNNVNNVNIGNGVNKDINNNKNNNISNMYLWHKRLGHLHMNGMNMLFNKHMTLDYPVLSSSSSSCSNISTSNSIHNTNNNSINNIINNNINQCLGCIMGKQHRTSMPHVATHRSTKPLQLIHSDVCGPMQTTSLGGARYFITFIDDYTRYVTVFTMKHKNEALHHFITYKKLVENQHQPFTIQSFRSDGGGEYISNTFNEYLRNNGIQRQQTPPHTPEHNGVAERMNRTLVEYARSMLHDANLPYIYWGEAIVTAAYLRNRCPTRALSSINLHCTPYEAWFGIGNKPSIAHLRIFGCKAYAHIPDVKRKKFDGKAIECIFVGYSSESKAYRLYDTTNKRIMVSRDVTFFENVIGNMNNNNQTNIGNTGIGNNVSNDVNIHSNIDYNVSNNNIQNGNIPSIPITSGSNVQSSELEISDESTLEPLNNDVGKVISMSDDVDSGCLTDNGVNNSIHSSNDNDNIPHIADSEADIQSTNETLHTHFPQSTSSVDNQKLLTQVPNTNLRKSTRIRTKPIPYWDAQAVDAYNRTMRNIHTSDTSSSSSDSVSNQNYSAHNVQVGFGNVGTCHLDDVDSVLCSNIVGDVSNIDGNVNNNVNDNNSYISNIHHDSENTNDTNITNNIINLNNMQIGDEPNTYHQAISSDNSKQWEQAMQEEYNSIIAAGTWSLVQLPSNRKSIGCKWVYKIKHNADGSIERYKARLVAKGFSQKEGIDYNETFAPVAKFCSIRALLALAAQQDMEIHQMDVKTAFLNGDIDVDIYMKQPIGYVVHGKEDYVCKLHKSLYGLKQAGRTWYQKIDNVLLHSLGFTRSQADHCVYVYNDNHTNVKVYIALYVDDLLIMCNNLSKLISLKQQLSQLFDMKDLGEAHYVLGIQIERDRTKKLLHISQCEYLKNVLERFGMSNSNPISTPLDVNMKLSKQQCPSSEDERNKMLGIPYQSAVGALMYAMLGTRPDIAYAITTLSQYCNNPGYVHWIALKRVLRYIRGTMNYKLTYGNIGNIGNIGNVSNNVNTNIVHGYCDADWGSNIDDRKSITGYVFLIHGGAVSWQAKKQPTVALSSVEAEYMSATQATKEALWWKTFLSQLGIHTKKNNGSGNNHIDDNVGCIHIYSDSQGSIALTKNPEYHSRTKHIDIQHHFVRDQVSIGNVSFTYVPTQDMLADVLTKSLSRDQHNKLIQMFGVHEVIK